MSNTDVITEKVYCIGQPMRWLSDLIGRGDNVEWLRFI